MSTRWRPVVCVSWAMVLTLWLACPALAATRVAVLLTAEAPAAGDTAIEAQLLAELSGDRRYDLLERQQVRTLLAEQNLSLTALADPATAVAVGQVLPVDLFVLLDAIELDAPAESTLTRQQVIESRTGILLDERLVPREQAQTDVAPLLAGLGRAARRQAIPHAERRYVTVAGVRSEAVGRELIPLARGLEALLAADLQRLERVLVLDRQHMRLLREEKALAPLVQRIQPATTVVEVSLAPENDQRVRVSLRFTGRGEDAAERIMAPREPESLRQEVLAEVARQLQQAPVDEPAMNSAQEARLFAARRESFRAHEHFEQAIAAGEAALLLDPGYERRDTLLATYNEASSYYTYGPVRSESDGGRLAEPAPPRVRWEAVARASELYHQLVGEFIAEGPDTAHEQLALPRSIDALVLRDTSERGLPEWRDLFQPAAQQYVTANHRLMGHLAGEDGDRYLSALSRAVSTQRMLLNDQAFFGYVRQQVEEFEKGIDAGWIDGPLRIRFDATRMMHLDAPDAQTLQRHAPILRWLAQRKDPLVRLHGHLAPLTWYARQAREADAGEEALSPVDRRKALQAARAVLEIHLIELIHQPEADRFFYPHQGEQVARMAAEVVFALDGWESTLRPVLTRALAAHEQASLTPMNRLFYHWLHPSALSSAVIPTAEEREQASRRLAQVRDLVNQTDLPEAYARQVQEMLAAFDGPQVEGEAVQGAANQGGVWQELAVREVDVQRPTDARHIAEVSHDGSNLVIFWETANVRDVIRDGEFPGNLPIHSWIIATQLTPDGQSTELGRVKLPDPLWSYHKINAEMTQFVNAAGPDAAFLAVPEIGLLRFHGGEAVGLAADQITAMAWMGESLYLGLYDDQPQRTSAVARLDVDAGELHYLVSSQSVERGSNALGDKPFFVWQIVADPREQVVWLMTTPGSSLRGETLWRLAPQPGGQAPRVDQREPEVADLRQTLTPPSQRVFQLGGLRVSNDGGHLHVQRGEQEHRRRSDGYMPAMAGYPEARFVDTRDTSGVPTPFTPAWGVEMIGPGLLATAEGSPHLLVICLPEDLARVPLPLDRDPRTKAPADEQDEPQLLMETTIIEF